MAKSSTLEGNASRKDLLNTLLEACSHDAEDPVQITCCSVADKGIVILIATITGIDVVPLGHAEMLNRSLDERKSLISAQ